MRVRSVAMDPRPTLDIENLSPPKILVRQRKLLLKTAVCQGKGVTRIVSRWRRLQRDSLSSTDSDPDPYHPSYVFYCLEMPRDE